MSNNTETAGVNPHQVSGLETEAEVAAFLKDAGFTKGIRELDKVIMKAGVAAVMAHVKTAGEITVPLTLAVVPSGSAPMFFDERTVRLARALCAAADVDADEWADSWIGAQIEASVETDERLGFSGITEDLMLNYGPEGGERSDENQEQVLAAMLSIVNEERAALELDPILPAYTRDEVAELERKRAEQPFDEKVIERLATDAVSKIEKSLDPDDSAGLVPLMVPAWMRNRLEEVAKISDVEGGVNALVEMEFGGLLRPGSGDCGLLGMITDSLGNWVFTDEERHQTRMDFQALAERWEKEDGVEPQPEAAASTEGGES